MFLKVTFKPDFKVQLSGLRSIKPIIEAVVKVGAQVFTDEYNIYNRLAEWGYHHKRVNHSVGQYARDDDGGGVGEIEGGNI